MKKWTISMLLPLTLGMSACEKIGISRGGTKSPAPRPAVQVCADFNGGMFADDHPFPSLFNFSIFRFSENAPTGNWFANGTAGIIGLQFFTPGGTASLSTPAHSVKIEAGGFSGQFEISAHDAKGAVIDKVAVPGTNRFDSYRLNGSNISEIRFSGGNNESVIVRICAEI